MMNLSITRQIENLEDTFNQYELEWADERAVELEYDEGINRRLAYLQALNELDSRRADSMVESSSLYAERI